MKRSDLALITCPHAKHIISTSALDKCFVNNNAVLCPTNVLQLVNEVEWLGYAWGPGMKLDHPRYHMSSKNCDDLHPMINLGGRYYLSTSTGTLNTNMGTLTVSPLTIYHFPCNVTFNSMKAGLSKCPRHMEITLPIFKKQTLTYIPWNMKDTYQLKLHYDSLKIPTPIKITDNVTDQLNKLYDLYDQRMKEDIDIANKDIDQIKEENTTTQDEIILYTVAAFTALNTIINLVIIIVYCKSPSPKQRHTRNRHRKN